MGKGEPQSGRRGVGGGCARLPPFFRRGHFPRRNRASLSGELGGFGADQLGGLVGFEGLVADVFALLVDDDNQGDGPRTVIVAEAAILVIENRYMHLVLPDETPDVVLGVELDGDGDGAESILGQLVRKLLDMREGVLAMR